MEACRSKELHCCGRQRPSPNLKFKKNSPKIWESKVWKSVSQFYDYWHTDHVCQVSRKSDKHCRRSSNFENVWITQTDRQPDRQTNRQTDRQTDTHRDRQTHQSPIQWAALAASQQQSGKTAHNFGENFTEKIVKAEQKFGSLHHLKIIAPIYIQNVRNMTASHFR